jgi:hypothetical protein
MKRRGCGDGGDVEKEGRNLIPFPSLGASSN